MNGLRDYIRRNPNKPAARQARLWLLEDSVVGGDWNFLVTDSPQTSRVGYLLALSRFKLRQGDANESAERDTTLTSSFLSDAETGAGPFFSWEVLEDWFEIRRVLEISPDDEGVRNYLEWEGMVRSTGLFNLWIAGLSFTPEGGRAREVLEDLIRSHGAEIKGSLEGAWLEQTMSEMYNQWPGAKNQRN